MNLDIQTEAQKLAARINGTNRTQGGRRGLGSRRLAMWLDGSVATFGVDTATAAYMMEHKQHRMIGVYTAPVTVEQLAEDLAEVIE